jgi:hypothetical protein
MEIPMDTSNLRELDRITRIYGEDKFFAVLSRNAWFICNWSMGFEIPKGKFSQLEMSTLCDRADIISSRSDTKKEILINVHRRSWTDIFLRDGRFFDAHSTHPNKHEKKLTERNDLIVFQQDKTRRRCYIRTEYLYFLDKFYANKRLVPRIFTPHGAQNYNPVVLINKGPIAIINTITHENLQRSNRIMEYAKMAEKDLRDEFSGRF